MPALPLADFRARFPILRRRVYVNNCSQGALSVDVEAAVAGFLESWREGGSPWDRWVDAVERLRGAVAAWIGADADDIAIVPSASAAISAIASALDFTGPRRRVVVGDLEFPTMSHVWLAQQPRGADVVFARAEGEQLAPSAYRALVDERTLIVPVTHVCYRNGLRLDVEQITAACHERGALVFLDDYQHTGTAPVDVRRLGVDFWVSGALKYLLGPSGVAFLYVRRDLVERLVPSVTGWFGRVNPYAFDPERCDWSPTARRFEGGTPPVPNAYAALAGLELLQAVGAEAIGRRIADLTARFHGAATEAGYRLLTPADPARRGPLVVVSSPDAPALVERLGRRGIVASARGRGVRISFHAYNDMDDIAVVLDALACEDALIDRVALPQGAR
jgi:selenocysteine lyase/cysteine desulfurase